MTGQPKVIAGGLLLPLLLAAAAAPGTANVTATLVLSGDTGPLAVLVRASPMEEAKAGPEQEVAGVEVETKAPGEVSLGLAPGRAWRLEASAPGYWAAPELILARGDHQRVSFRLQPTGRVTGRLGSTSEDKTPSALVLRAEAVPGEKSGQLGFELRCPVLEGYFSCEVPAGVLDLSLRAQGFVTHYRWDLAVKAGKVLDLGELALRRGASVTGWVQTAQPPSIDESCRVELSPVVAGPAMTAADEQRRERLRVSSHTDSRGFFHFEGVEPGGYLLTAVQPGFVPETQQITVSERSETRLRQALTLKPPSRLELWLDPSHAPNGEPWRVALLTEKDAPGRLSPVTKAPELAPDGHWSREGLGAGQYHLQVLGPDGASVAHERVTLSSAGSTLSLTLPMLELAGEVFLGDQPLQATLFFGGQNGLERITLHSDAEGAFQGYLPALGEGKSGEWRLDVVAEEPRVFRRLRHVRLQTSDEGRHAHLSIRLPSTRLSGSVIDQQGKPVPGATIFTFGLSPPDLGPTTQADALGTFSLEGLEPGRYQVLAERGQRESTPTIVELSTKPPLPLELVLLDKKSIEGRALSASGPVPGAVARLLPSLGGQVVEGSAVPGGTTNPAGLFQLTASPWADGGYLMVMAPGFSLASQTIARLPTVDLVVPLRQDGGTLTLLLPAEVDWLDWESPKPLVFRDALVPLDLRMLLQWAAMNGASSSDPRRLAFPALEPGGYTVCLFDRTLPLHQAMALIRPEACASGFLSSGGELELTLVRQKVR